MKIPTIAAAALATVSLSGGALAQTRTFNALTPAGTVFPTDAIPLDQSAALGGANATKKVTPAQLVAAGLAPATAGSIGGVRPGARMTVDGAGGMTPTIGTTTGTVADGGVSPAETARALAQEATISSVANAAVPLAGGTMTGGLIAPTLGAMGFAAGTDTANGNVAIGRTGGTGTPYLDFIGNGVAGQSARIISQAANQLTLAVTGGSMTVTPTQVYSSLPVYSTGSVTAANGLFGDAGAATVMGRTQAARTADTIDIMDAPYGAKCDGATDDTAAINAATAAFRTSSVNNNRAATLRLGHGNCRINNTINLTGLTTNTQSATIDGTNSVIQCATVGKQCIDATGSDSVRWNNLHIRSVAGTPTIGLQIARATADAPCGEQRFFMPSITGIFSVADFYNGACEGVTYYSPHFSNDSTSPTSYAAIFDGVNHWNEQSAFVTVTWPRDSLNSFNENTIHAGVLESLGGSTLWIAAAHRITFDNTYSLTTTTAPAVVLYDFGGNNIDLVFDLHFEAQPSAIFKLTGAAAQKINGLKYRDHFNQATANVFVADAGVTSVSLLNADIDVAAFVYTATMFDQPSIYTVAGHVNTPATPWNLPSAQMTGMLCLDGVCRPVGDATAAAALPKSGGTMTGVLNGPGFAAGNDPTNGSIAVGTGGGSGTPYIDFLGNGLPAGQRNGRITSPAVNQLSLSVAAGAVTLGANLYSTLPIYSTVNISTAGVVAGGSLSATGSATAQSLVLTGSVPQGSVLAGPAGAAGAPTQRTLTVADVSGAATAIALASEATTARAAEGTLTTAASGAQTTANTGVTNAAAEATRATGAEGTLTTAAAAAQTTANAALPKAGGTLTGSLFGPNYSLGSDAPNGNLALGLRNTGNPYIDFLGNGLASGTNARIVSQAQNQLTLSVATGAVTLGANLYSTLPIYSTVNISTAGVVAGGSLSATGTATALTEQIGGPSGPTQATGTAAPLTTTFDGVTGHTAGTPVAGSEYICSTCAPGARVLWYFGSAWVAQATP